MYSHIDLKFEDEDEDDSPTYYNKLKLAFGGAVAAGVLYYKGDKLIEYIKNSDFKNIFNFLSKMKKEEMVLDESSQEKIINFLDKTQGELEKLTKIEKLDRDIIYNGSLIDLSNFYTEMCDIIKNMYTPPLRAADAAGPPDDFNLP